MVDATHIDATHVDATQTGPPHKSGRWLAALVCVLAQLALSGCPNYSCTDVGCDGNLQCNAETGACEELVQSCTQSGCPDGKTCEPATGLCRSEGARCVDDNCPAQQVCNARTGFCEARSDCETDPCTSLAEECDSTTGQCVPIGCQSDDACPPAYYCSDADQCQAGCRLSDDSACPGGQFCRGAGTDTIGQCRDQCHSDQACPLGQRCRPTDDGSSCEVEAPCESDRDCRADGVCYDRRCRPPPCTGDTDCPADQRCDAATGMCFGGDCSDDIQAPNQRIDDAAQLRPGRYSELTLCAGASDWFGLDVRSSDVTRLRLEHDAGADLDVFVYDSNRRLVASNQQVGPVTTLEWLAERSQTVAIQVRADTRTTQTYGLNIERNPDASYCRDDSFEENDHPDDAKIIPTDTSAPVEVDLQICGSDPDWFVLPQLAADQGISIGQRDAGAAVLTRVLTPDDKVFELSADLPADRPGRLRFARVGVAGDYLIGVRSPHHHSQSYGLRTQVLGPLACPGAQSHESPDMAAALAADTPTSEHTLCPLDNGWEIDWLALPEPEKQGTLVSEVVALGDLPGLNVVLFKAGDDQPRRVRRAVRDDARYRLQAPVEAGKTYLIRVSADGQPGRIRDGVGYELTYGVDSAE